MQKSNAKHTFFTSLIVILIILSSLIYFTSNKKHVLTKGTVLQSYHNDTFTSDTDFKNIIFSFKTLSDSVKVNIFSPTNELKYSGTLSTNDFNSKSFTQEKGNWRVEFISEISKAIPLEYSITCSDKKI